MGDENDVTLVIDQMFFQPCHAFCIKVVCRFVEQKDVGLFKQQPRQRNPAFLAARQADHASIPRWATQCIHRQFELAVERPAVDRIDLFLQGSHFFHQRVEIGIFRWVAHDHRNFIEPVNQIGHRAHAVHHVLTHGFSGVELRLLRQIADCDMFACPRFAGKFGIHARHDLHQRRFTGAVRSDNADFCIRIKLQVDIAQHRFVGAGERFGHPLHHVAILRGHGKTLFKNVGDLALP